MFVANLSFLAIALFAGCTELVHAQTEAATQRGKTTRIWWPHGIPGGKPPSTINAVVSWIETSSTKIRNEWVLSGYTTPTASDFFGPKPTELANYWPKMKLYYGDFASVVVIDCQETYETAVVSNATYSAIDATVFVNGICTSMQSTAQCHGSYGVKKTYITSAMPSGRTDLPDTTPKDPQYRTTQVDTTLFPSNPPVTALPVTVDGYHYTGNHSKYPKPTTSPPTTSSTGGLPRATGNAGVVVGAAVAVGGAMLL